jgi:RNA polymerase sigma-70 factor (ECF subfamily)
MQFREIYDAQFAYVWRSLRRLGVADANLRDAVQDAFVVVHRRLPDFEGRAKVTTWLFRICLRIAKDYRRRAHVRREVLDESHFPALSDPKANAEHALEQRQDLQIFDAALDQLDFDKRSVFILFELEEMTGDQIAELLEIPLGTVYSRLRLAREAFRHAVLQHTKRAPQIRVGGTK